MSFQYGRSWLTNVQPKAARATDDLVSEQPVARARF